MMILGYFFLFLHKHMWVLIRVIRVPTTYVFYRDLEKIIPELSPDIPS